MSSKRSEDSLQGNSVQGTGRRTDQKSSPQSSRRSQPSQPSSDELLQLVPGPYVSKRPAVSPIDTELSSVVSIWQEKAHVGRTVFDTTHARVLDLFRIDILGGRAEGRYLQWHVNDLPQLWLLLSLQPPYSESVEAYRTIPNYPLYVEIRNGGPGGEFFSRLVKDKRRVRGLFIQMFGYPNEIPCENCERLFMESDTQKYAGMRPFFGCRSLLQFKGVCGNCFYHIKDSTCTFREAKYCLLIGNPDRDLPLEERLQERWCPARYSLEGDQLREIADSVVGSAD
ncbi:hypothetical protein GGR53DRAFT_191925 [Hypoxylon sp. FL1150]|nr:hypothetical protein GGR53DRAFT_191925 [Hypoxylon sp. FL1150]